MYQLIYTSRFQKDIELLKSRGFELQAIKKVIIELEETGRLSIQNRPHKLWGNYLGYWEAHIKPDWLLIWKKIKNEIWLTRTGTHADLFG